jgi:hypothetical protein
MFMKAYKSDLAKQLFRAGIRVPFKEGAKIAFNSKEYTVRYIPTKAS